MLHCCFITKPANRTVSLILALSTFKWNSLLELHSQLDVLTETWCSGRIVWQDQFWADARSSNYAKRYHLRPTWYRWTLTGQSLILWWQRNWDCSHTLLYIFICALSIFSSIPEALWRWCYKTASAFCYYETKPNIVQSKHLLSYKQAKILIKVRSQYRSHKVWMDPISGEILNTESKCLLFSEQLLKFV